ncbi:DUF6944 family repetitive protein [Peribacillus sp. JNUCC 23]
MDDQIKALFGSWVQAIGTFIAAVGSTPSPILSKEQLTDLSLIGNGFENLNDPGESINVVVNILQRIGNSLQALGGIEELRNKDDQGETLGIAGSWIQTIGSVMSAIEQTKETVT